MGPGDVKSPRVIVKPPSSRFCPWLALRPPHYAVRGWLPGSSYRRHKATCGRFTCKLTLPELVRLYRLTPARPPGTPGRATTSARPRVLQPDWSPQTKRS